MKKSASGHSVDVVFVLAIACGFAASILMVLMLGANIYGNIQKTSDAQFNERVCLSYVSAKIHASDRSGDLEVGDFQGASALYLNENFDDTPYNTIIYSYDGWIRELFCEKGLDLPPDAGAPIMEARSIRFNAVKPNLLSIEYSDKNGGAGEIFVNLRSEGGGVT